LSTAINPSDLCTSVTIFLKPFLVLSPPRALNLFASFTHTWRTRFLIKHQGVNYSKIVSSRYFVRALKLECVHVVSCHVTGYAQYHSRRNISIHLYTRLLSINKVWKQEFFYMNARILPSVRHMKLIIYANWCDKEGAYGLKCFTSLLPKIEGFILARWWCTHGL